MSSQLPKILLVIICLFWMYWEFGFPKTCQESDGKRKTLKTSELNCLQIENLKDGRMYLGLKTTQPDTSRVCRHDWTRLVGEWLHVFLSHSLFLSSITFILWISSLTQRSQGSLKKAFEMAKNRFCCLILFGSFKASHVLICSYIPQGCLSVSFNLADKRKAHFSIYEMTTEFSANSVTLNQKYH